MLTTAETRPLTKFLNFALCLYNATNAAIKAITREITAIIGLDFSAKLKARTPCAAIFTPRAIAAIALTIVPLAIVASDLMPLTIARLLATAKDLRAEAVLIVAVFIIVNDLTAVDLLNVATVLRTDQLFFAALANLEKASRILTNFPINLASGPVAKF